MSCEKPASLIVVYPGRFQPFHPGHLAAYRWLQEKFASVEGAHSYIAISPVSDHPFSLAQRKSICYAAGINPREVVVADNPYRAASIGFPVGIFQPSVTKLVIGVAEKDMQQPKPRFNLSDDPSDTKYFRPYHNVHDAECADRHGYICVIPTQEFVGPAWTLHRTKYPDPIISATELRNQLKDTPRKTAHWYLSLIYPHATDVSNIHTMFEPLLKA